ncbi:YopX family protein [Streptococcus mitis]|uniref:YopX family protein n=1 Tax=Streptococcus mitis TaxID=28037 RepID=UPI0002EC401F|nr:YopX family protein [Streptococcus mitis]DAK10669.1 MAG TPA: YopX protein [Caudoviricetes sp.]
MIPKFRAWDSVEKKFVEHFFITDNGLICNMEKPTSDCKLLIPIEKSELILMQSTGLKDKNDKEIFEGDIVKMSKDVYSEPTYYEVVRHRGGAYRLESKQHGCELWLRHTDCEIVGNVYENKELLDA